MSIPRRGEANSQRIEGFFIASSSAFRGFHAAAHD